MNMITQQLRTNEILEQSILDLYQSVPRDFFVPIDYKAFAYSDLQIPLMHNQRMNTPLEEASILQALNLQGHETVLEVGTGSGFLTALLSKMCKKVITLDYFADFTNNARAKLYEQNIENVEFITADGSRGYVDRAPFDAIIFTCAMEVLTKTHMLQVVQGGKIFAILGRDPIMQAQLFSLNLADTWTQKLLFETNVEPMIDKLSSKQFIF